jgi:hypothetical protein
MHGGIDGGDAFLFRGRRVLTLIDLVSKDQSKGQAHRQSKRQNDQYPKYFSLVRRIGPSLLLRLLGYRWLFFMRAHIDVAVLYRETMFQFDEVGAKKGRSLQRDSKTVLISMVQ